MAAFSVFLGFIVVWMIVSHSIEIVIGKKTIAGKARTVIYMLKVSIDKVLMMMKVLQAKKHETYTPYSGPTRNTTSTTRCAAPTTRDAPPTTRDAPPTTRDAPPTTRSAPPIRNVSIFQHHETEVLPNCSDSSSAHTYENWLKKGYQVKKGEKAAYKFYGQYIFRRDQVVMKR